MNRALCLALAAAMFSVVSGGCDQASSTGATGTATPVARAAAEPVRAKGDGSPPVITFASLTHDFGTMLETETRTARIEFTNTGGSTLVIKDVKTSCGCTVATPDKREYAPGEDGHVEVEFDPAGPGENQRKYVKLITNTEQELTQVAIIADVEPFVIIEPRTLALGVIPHREEHRAALTVTSSDPDFVIESVRMSNRSFVVRQTGVVEPATGDAPRKEGLEVVIPAETPWGPLFSWLEMDVRGRPTADGDPITYNAKVRVQGQRFGALRAEPDTFRFGAQPGEAFEREIVLKRADGAPFSVLRADVTANRIDDPQVRVEPLGPGEYRIVLTARGGSMMASANGVVLVSTDVAGEERIDIPISGVIRRTATVR